MFRYNSPYLDVGVLSLEDLTDAAYGAAGANTGAEAVDGHGHLLKNFKSGVALVDQRVVSVGELLGNIYVGVGCLHIHGGLQTLLYAQADVAVVVNLDDLSAVLTH